MRNAEVSEKMSWSESGRENAILVKEKLLNERVESRRWDWLGSWMVWVLWEEEEEEEEEKEKNGAERDSTDVCTSLKHTFMDADDPMEMGGTEVAKLREQILVPFTRKLPSEIVTIE